MCEKSPLNRWSAAISNVKSWKFIAIGITQRIKTAEVGNASSGGKPAQASGR